MVDHAFHHRGWAGATIKRAVAAACRADPALKVASLNDQPLREALRAASIIRPPGRKYGASPDDWYDPARLVTEAAGRDDRLLKALVAVRLGAGIRTGDASGILLSTVRQITTATQSRAVAFKYRSKTTARRERGLPTGYIEYSEDANRCLATWFWQYCQARLQQAPQPANDPAIDFVFTRPGTNERLPVATMSAKLHRTMVDAGIPARFRPHSLRMALVTKALLGGATIDALACRFQWASQETLRNHYALVVAPFNLSNIS